MTQDPASSRISLSRSLRWPRCVCPVPFLSSPFLASLAAFPPSFPMTPVLGALLMTLSHLCARMTPFSWLGCSGEKKSEMHDMLCRCDSGDRVQGTAPSMVAESRDACNAEPLLGAAACLMQDGRNHEYAMIAIVAACRKRHCIVPVSKQPPLPPLPPSNSQLRHWRLANILACYLCLDWVECQTRSICPQYVIAPPTQSACCLAS